jgi:Na+-transporting methylmalonyl-CoA/oxaloacetate decarboxylase gamma subunit
MFVVFFFLFLCCCFFVCFASLVGETKGEEAEECEEEGEEGIGIEERADIHQEVQLNHCFHLFSPFYEITK